MHFYLCCSAQTWRSSTSLSHARSGRQCHYEGYGLGMATSARVLFHLPRYKGSLDLVDLEGLLHLAQYCHALESATHRFNLSLPAHIIQERPGRGVYNKSMAHLCVGRSPVTNPHAVAAFLLKIFSSPQLSDSWSWVDITRN
jgi:hypothetical protein